MNLKTDEISKALGRGKHTTRHVELINALGGFIADTPGFSDVSFIGMSREDIRDNFIEFNECVAVKFNFTPKLKSIISNIKYNIIRILHA